MARSRWLPSSRTGLFAIGERSTPQSLDGEKVLTTTGGGVHRVSFRCARADEGVIPYRVGVLASHGPMVVHVRRLTVAVFLRRIRGNGRHGL